jgi:L-aspartate oxidase
VRRRFPNIARELQRWGFDLTAQPIPVVPAAHYLCGGVRSNLAGVTTVRGLLALGETACTGLHGANRLASNSLLEGLVMAHDAVPEIRRRLDEASVPGVAPWSSRGTRPSLEKVVFDHNWDTVRRVMWDLVGIVRTDQRLAFARRRLALLREEIEADYRRLRLGPDLVELRNIALVGSLVVECAQRRRESRGLHYTLDHPRPGARGRRRTVLARARLAARVAAAL